AVENAGPPVDRSLFFAALEPGPECANSAGNIGVWRIVEVATGVCDIGECDRDVSGLDGFAHNAGGFSDDVFHHGDEFRQRRGADAAEVVDVVALGLHPFACGGSAGDDVVDVRVVAATGTVAEPGNRLVGGDGSDEFMDGHVRPLPGAIDGEKAQTADADA